VRADDTLVTPNLDRLARSVPDAREIGDSLAARDIRLQLGTMVYDPTDPMDKMFLNILATFAEFEVDLLRMRTREGMAIARAKGKLKGRAPKLPATRQAHLLKLHDAGAQPSPNWPSCSRSPARRCAGHWNASARTRTPQRWNRPP
jgi:DNA invertase Pin-like site-specific DNA recombinase